MDFSEQKLIMTIKEVRVSAKKKYWSKRKRYGWGWIPVTWQDRSVLGVWLVFFLGATLIIDESSPNTAWVFFSLILLSLIPLTIIFYKTGPSPKWRWGKKDSDDPNLDW